MTKEVKLLGTMYSPFTRRAQLGLMIKGVEFEYIEEDLSNKSPLLLESNPVLKKVPVLLHNGKPVADSMIILEYIDEAWPDNYPLLPKDPHERAKARFWAKFVDNTMVQTAYKSMTATEKEQEEIREQVCQYLDLLENELKGKEFFGGEAIGLVDVMLFHITCWFQIREEVTGIPVLGKERFPVLRTWIAKLSEMDVVKESLPPKDKLLAFIRARFEAMKATYQVND